MTTIEENVASECASSDCERTMTKRDGAAVGCGWEGTRRYEDEGSHMFRSVLSLSSWLMFGRESVGRELRLLRRK